MIGESLCTYSELYAYTLHTNTTQHRSKCKARYRQYHIIKKMARYHTNPSYIVAYYRIHYILLYT